MFFAVNYKCYFPSIIYDLTHTDTLCMYVEVIHAQWPLSYSDIFFSQLLLALGNCQKKKKKMGGKTIEDHHRLVTIHLRLCSWPRKRKKLLLFSFSLRINHSGRFSTTWHLGCHFWRILIYCPSIMKKACSTRMCILFKLSYFHFTFLLFIYIFIILYLLLTCMKSLSVMDIWRLFCLTLSKLRVPFEIPVVTNGFAFNEHSGCFVKKSLQNCKFSMFVFWMNRVLKLKNILLIYMGAQSFTNF